MCVWLCCGALAFMMVMSVEVHVLLKPSIAITCNPCEYIISERESHATYGWSAARLETER